MGVSPTCPMGRQRRTAVSAVQTLESRAKMALGRTGKMPVPRVLKQLLAKRTHI